MAAFTGVFNPQLYQTFVDYLDNKEAKAGSSTGSSWPFIPRRNIPRDSDATSGRSTVSEMSLQISNMIRQQSEALAQFEIMEAMKYLAQPIPHGLSRKDYKAQVVYRKHLQEQFGKQFYAASGDSDEDDKHNKFHLIEISKVCRMEDKTPREQKKYAADIDSISKAQARIQPYIHVTPVLTSETLNSVAAGKSLFFKCECFQKGGAFKFRGASNAIFSLDDDQAAKGVVTHSSGNHAAALALAAKLRGIPAYIVIPKNAPKCKVENVKRYGGQIIWSEANMQSREETANKVLHETGAVLVHPYNDGRIISGQGTLSLEFLDQVPQLDTLIVPISGGGLISGVVIGAKSINPAIRVLAAEPKGADDAAQSKASGKIITLAQTNTIADGLRASLGDLTWPIVRDLVDGIITVDDKEIVEAMKYCYEILKVAIEPSGAIGLAAVLSETFKQDPAWKDSLNIGIVLSGGNVDLGALWDSLNTC